MFRFSCAALVAMAAVFGGDSPFALSSASAQEEQEPAAETQPAIPQQDQPDDPAPAAAGSADAPATDLDATPETAAQEQEPAPLAGQPEGPEGQQAEPATEQPPEENLPAGAQSPLPDESAPGMNPFVILAIVIALFVVPILIGNLCAKRFRMPDHGWRISVALGTIAAAAVSIGLGELKGGPDLVGGITLIYEIEDPEELERGPDGEVIESPDGRIDMGELIGALTRRINPSGTKEVTIREYGAAQVEIIVPKAGVDELQQLKDTITNLGQLEFRIVASQRDPDHAAIVREAMELSPYDKDVEIDGQVVATWVPYDVAEFGPIDAPDPVGERDMPKRLGKDRRNDDVPETLVLIDDLEITGAMLETTWADTDQAGRPAVSFRFNAQGAARFGRLTGRNLPNEATGQHKFLGILLNRELQSAPSIRSRIDDQGIIEGDFTEEEVESLVNVLNAGRLPAALNPTPLSEQVISPTLGAATVRQGAISIVVSLILVLLFMLFYYRFAGVIACMALVANLLLVVGAMVLFDADFTLAGLAGLVLTIGMSVDANVLIFERIREELARGAALRMAIRNGFDKAKSAIYDANVTTLLTGIVLFWIGTDQIKGFATVLIIGIIMSVFTAVFCSRIVFDVAEKQGWIRRLRMMQIVGNTNIDFLGMRLPAIAASCVLIVVGIVAVIERGRDMLNIDFTGGVSASMVLKENVEMTQAEVRQAIEATPLGDRNLLVVEQQELNVDEEPDQQKFMVYARIDDEDVPQTGTEVVTAVQYVQNVLEETFGDALETYSVDVEGLTAIPTPGEEDPATDLELTPAEAAEFAGGTHAILRFNVPVAYTTVEEELLQILPEQNEDRPIRFSLDNDNYAEGTAERFVAWTLMLNIPPDAARPLLAEFESRMDGSPLFPLASTISGQVAGDMQQLAALAIFFSLLCIIGYIWLRFQQVMFGLAAVIAVIHDVLITVGLLAVSAWIVNFVPPLATALQLEPFQISLQVVAALLTIIGYSLNDTIVIFDRIREVRGKSPQLTKEMINTSVNQTLSRTLMTSFTTFMVVAILYLFGGSGIHAFAFSLVVGVLAGTYSTVFIASPALLWMSKPAQE